MDVVGEVVLSTFLEVVNDAEEKRFEKPVNGAWLKQLKHVVYDAEDVLDEIAFKAMEAFITGLQVSKILITTRNVGVSSIMRTVPDHYVEQLPEEDCWSLLRQHAFENESSINPQLEFIGKKIVRKCKGWKMFEAEQHYPIPENARHLSYVPDYYEPFTKFGALGKTETSLRTFLPLGRGRRFSYLPEMALLELLQKLNRIRVFSLNGYQIVSLPESIGNLRHLRYLDLSYTSIRNLPESTGTLYNLQTLLLIGCQSLIELPSNMGKLLNLQYLDASQSGLMKMPHGIGRLIKLQRLSNFIIGKNNETGIRELRELSSPGKPYNFRAAKCS
ncbi:hypothetical protein GH714_025678 [Hevea brasiliensis]|uniref:NB-ARC domain-containing protein n=1 Tax=Hevea brasiliensis TaxID=3981 RepID=A0A6A6M412_HEVBR|nr:hypothetical protein GH714_025678 [Hevea brasiliensis]